jgi:hypothetical protein
MKVVKGSGLLRAGQVHLAMPAKAMIDLFKDLKSVRKANGMQRNVQARTQDGGGYLSYGNPAPRRNQAAFRECLYLWLVTQNLEEPVIRSRLTVTSRNAEGVRYGTWIRPLFAATDGQRRGAASARSRQRCRSSVKADHAGPCAAVSRPRVLRASPRSSGDHACVPLLRRLPYPRRGLVQP